MNNTSQQAADYDDDDLLGGDNTSPESAAIARGAARTAAARGTQRVMAGRLPVPSSAAATSVATKASKTISSTPRVSVRNVPRTRIPKTPKIRVPKARANTIAKATDRASKGYDILSARLEQNQSVVEAKSHDSTTKRRRRDKNNIQQYKKSITQALQQVTSFGKIFITNTILGMALFATYEGVIDYVAPSLVEKNTTNEDDYIKVAGVSNGDVSDGASNDDITVNEIGDNDDDAMDRATLLQHFLAGAMAGTSHAILSLALEIKRNVSPPSSSATGKSAFDVTFNNLIQPHKPIRLQFPTLNYSAAYIFHHSLAHSVLFGSYQLTKRLLIQNITSDSMMAAKGTNNASSAGSCNNDAILHLSCIAMAGGLAGQFQHVTSHISEQCLGLVDETKNFPTSLLRRLQLASWPTWRSTMVAFPPSAIGFLAFEYGKMMMADDDDDH